jgi:penicillin-binding protein 2
MPITAVANGQRFFLPQIVQRVEDIYGSTLKEYPPVEMRKGTLSEKTLQIVREGLRGVVNEPHGTGGAAALKEIQVAGKTGTAQVVRMEKNFRKGDTDRMAVQYRDHAWFVAYAPFENPTISVAVLVEHGGHGGSAAAPIAKKVIETYLRAANAPPLKMAEKPGDSQHDD